MKKLIGVLVCMAPLAVYAQQTYTNEDLKKFTVVGRAAPMAPVAYEEVDARPYQMRLDLLQEQRTIVQAQLDWTNQQIEKAYSFFDKGPDGYPWPGFYSKNKGFLQYLDMQLSVIDARIEEVEDEARSAGAILYNK
jgi:hypothetical protein